jgi:hypothetical protein
VIPGTIVVAPLDAVTSFSSAAPRLQGEYILLGGRGRYVVQTKALATGCDDRSRPVEAVRGTGSHSSSWLAVSEFIVWVRAICASKLT